MANLAGRNPFLALDDMDIGIYPGATPTDQEKALAATSIIHAAYEELGPSPSNLDSGIATALANRSFAGAKVTVSSGWTGSVQVGSKTQTGINIAADPVLADFPIFYVSPEAWRLQYALPAAGSIEVNIAEDGTNVNLTIDWGDLSTPDVYTTTGIKSHAYASAGSYEVKITGSITEGNIQFSGAGANQLTAINAPLQGITGITSFAQTFYNCSSLTSLPADLFGYTTAATSFNSTFAYCTSLTSLPADLFGYNTAAASFGNTFSTCVGLTSLPTDLFRYTTAVGNFISAFAYCTSLTSLPTDLFGYNTAVTDFNSTFSGCSGLTSLPADLFRYTTAVTDFNATFSTCIGLTLRSDIFGTDYANCFLNRSVVFTESFLRSSFTGTQGVAPELWSFDFGTGTPVKTQCFGLDGNSLTSLSNYASIPSGWIS